MYHCNSSNADALQQVNSLPENKILDWSKLKEISHENCFERVANIVGKAMFFTCTVNSFSIMFATASFSRGMKSWDCVVKIKTNTRIPSCSVLRNDTL